MAAHAHTYQKRFWLIFCILIISNTAFAIDVEYIVTIDNPSSGEANIKMTITNLSSESFSIQSIKNVPNEPKADVISIVAKDINDKILNIHPYPSVDPFKWTVNTSGLSQCTIEYTIKPKAYSARYFCYISQDFVLAPSWAVFLIPVNGFWIKPDILKISLNVPKSWQKIVPWPFRGGSYYPLEILSPNWFDTFPTTAFVLGNVDSYLKKIGNTDITVAFYGSWPSNFVQNSVNKVMDIYSYFASVWGNTLDYPYNVVFFPMSINGNLVVGNESSLDKLVEYDLANPPKWIDFSTDICESRWINMDWGYVDNSFGWAKSGFSMLYGSKSVAKVRMESLGWLEGYYFGMRDYYFQRVNNGRDLPLASDEADKDRDLLWSKGSLATLLLAKEIHSRTNGTLIFDDLNKRLFEKYSGNFIHEEELLSEINSLTGLDFQQFFNDYIYGTELLPLYWMFKDNDGEGLSNLSELFWNTDPEKIDTDGDGYSDAVEVAKYSDPLDPTSIPGQFTDVPPGYWAEEEIYKFYNAGITTGCSKNPLKYCPLRDVNRAQMAVFLERGINDGDYTPPPATGIFDDVPVTHWAADWIEQLYKDGITTGCTQNPPKYCPDRAVNRAQMAVFLLRAKHGKNYTPPSAKGIFADVPVTYWAADWIEQLYKEGITSGCSTNPLEYCPLKVVNRAQMAVFLSRTFGL